MRAAEIEDVRDARCQDTGFPGSGARQNQYGPVQALHRLALLRVEVGEVSRASRPKRPRGDAARGGRG